MAVPCSGLDELLAEELRVPVLVAEDPMHCVVKGTGIMLDNLDHVVKKSSNLPIVTIRDSCAVRQVA